jgi:MFS family permease
VMNRVLRAVTIATTMAFLGMGGIAVTAVLFAEHLGERADTGGQLIAAFAVGALAGSLAAARWLSARRAEWVLVSGMVAFGAALAAIVLAPNLPWAAAGFVAAGICDGPVFAATLTVRQREAPADRLGQVNTTGGSLKIGSAALGAALTSMLADHVGATGLLLGMAALQLLGALLGALLLIPRKRR